MFSYYQCNGRRKLHVCLKAHERKELLEAFVVEQTVKHVLTPERMDYIADGVVNEYNKEFNTDKMKALEKQVAKLDRDINKFIDMLLDAPKSSHPKIYDKMENAQAMKDDLEVELSKLHIANKIRYTKAEIISWLKMFCQGDLLDIEFKKRIIDTFVNSVYVYDDRVIIFYNIRGSKKVPRADMFNSTKGIPARSGQDAAHNAQTDPAIPSGICISDNSGRRPARTAPKGSALWTPAGC